MKEMKIDIYDSFSCIADNCSLTCCQQWKITIDNETVKRWEQLENNFDEPLLKHVVNEDENYIMKLNEKRTCPHLNKQKLCSLVEKYGEESISETCRIFPREIHDFGNRKEYALVACCPEVVDMLGKIEQIHFTGEEQEYKEDVLYFIRKLLISILKDTTISLAEGLLVCFYILLELLEQEELTLEHITCYQEKGMMEELVKTIREMEFNRLDTFDERNELFLDVSDNYRKQQLYADYLENIGQEAEQLLEGYAEEELLKLTEQFKSQIGKYDTLMRNYVVSELYNTILIPESDYFSMVVMMQWIGLQYAVMQHAMFLKWKIEGCKNLDYETVRNYIVIISRMTGYDQEDIFEYLENSFQELIWEWGYFALVTGSE